MQNKQNEIFQKIYNGLNEQQKLAVDTIEGPVIVNAGPGTGKTQILSARIGKILLETDTQPSNILCLTYTDAGAVAMRKRLQTFMGSDAYKVNIYTFHAFCNQVIQDNLSLFEKNSLDPISELERIELFKTLIDNLPKGHPLKRYRGDVYFEIKNLQSLFSMMKRENLGKAKIFESIDEYVSDLENRDEFIYQTSRAGKWKKGDRKPSYENEITKMEKLRAAVTEFDNYQLLMREKNRYDFDDMIGWVIKAFNENKNLLAEYQEKFLYILVDEYQDTNGSQNDVLNLLIEFWKSPNIFVVGDADQSIFSFQGANELNLSNFKTNFKDDFTEVILTNNYRSTQSILDASKTLIEKNSNRTAKTLISSNKKINQLSHKPVLKEYETASNEMIDIVLQAEMLLQQGIQPGRIAVIYKENKYGEELGKYFKLKNIPIYSKRSLNILDIPLIKKITLLLRYLASEHDIPYSGDEMLFEILHFDWFQIPPVEIANMTIYVAQKRYTQDETSIRKFLYDKSNKPSPDLFTQNIHPNLQKASDNIELLIADVSNVTLQILIERIIQQAGVLKTIMRSDEKIWLLQVLNGFYDFIKDETHRHPSLTLQQLVNIIDLMEKEGLNLPLTQVSGSEKGINLLTAHGSKGLEFEHVFFAGCNASSWEKKRKPFGGYSFPDTMFETLPAHNEDEELRRLFYVAMTRAEQHLSISYTRFKNDGKEIEPSMFIAEIQEQHELPTQKIFIDENILTEFQTLIFTSEQAPEIAKIEEEYINAILEKFVMNVSALNNFLKCPLEFYFKNLLRIPSPKNDSLEFGSAVHDALDKLFKDMQNNNEQFSSKEIFIENFKKYMFRHRESFTKEQFDRRLEYGETVLTNYYDKYVKEWNKIVAVERTIKNVVVNGVPLKGKLDKLEFNGKDANVVDYKTGDPDKAKDKLQQPNDDNKNGGDYWRQAVFYKILVDNYTIKKWNVVSTEFDFIEPDKKKIYRKNKLVISPEDITTVKQQITTSWEKIQSHDFYTGCGKEDCHWCNFVKTNNLAIALHEIVEEDSEA
jgi:DNA helicase II / ATP-dependent DNA helicase PcrA